MLDAFRRPTTKTAAFDGHTVEGIPMRRGRTLWPSSASATETEALGVPAYLNGLRFIASQMGTFPLHTFDGRVRVEPAPWIVERPDPRFTQRDIVGQLAVSVAARGNAFAICDFRDLAVPSVLTVVHPSLVQWDVRQGVYIVSHDPASTSGRDAIAVEPGAMLHLRGLTLPGSRFGVDPLTLCAESLGYAGALQRHAQRFLTEGATFSAVIKVNRKDWSAAQTEDLKAKLLEVVGTREPLVIPGDHEFQALPMLTPENTELVESRKFAMVDVANVLGLNVRWLNGTPGFSMTYANSQQDSLDLIRNDLAPYIAAIEDGFTDLLRPLAWRAKFNLSARLRADDKTRMETHAIALEKKIRTIDEVRDLEDLPPIDNTEDAA